MITPPNQDQMKGLSVSQLIELLGSNQKLGLSSDEVISRTQQFGLNEIPEKRKNPFLQFLKKFWGPSAWMIGAIAALSLFLHKRFDFYVAAGLLVVNAVIGFLQERRAEQVVKMLQSKLQIQTRTLRDGKWSDLPARALVPGDIVRLRMGDFVPADLKIVSGDITIDQSSITGESAELARSVDDEVYSASIVRQGEFLGLVVLTGIKTFYGRTVELVQKSRPKLHMEEVVSKLVKWLFAVVGSVVILVIAIGLIRGTSMTDILPLGLVLLMGAVPIALPVMFTVSTALGARDLGKKGVLVTRLSATEDAATMQVLCVDKTGTLTINQLVVKGLYPEEKIVPEDLLLCAALSSNSSNRDSIDAAILEYASKQNVLIDHYKQVQFVPFSPQTRKTEASIEGEKGPFKVMKGALKAIASIAKLPPDQTQRLEASSDLLAKKGYRTIAVAKIVADQIQFLGLVALYDPPRPDSAELITRLHSLGLSVKMLTGDAVPVAQQIASEVGLGKIIPLGTLQLTNLDWLKDNDGIAGVFPEDKYTVIKALQVEKIVTGMTGDGVNDSPALQAAEVGIAVKGATDAARAAASVVLTESGLSGIVDLVENGRSVYQRILTWVINKISRTVLKTGFVGLAYIFTGHLLISALGMLVLTFMTDFAKITLATDRVRPSQTPDTWKILPITFVAMALGVCMIFEALGLLWIGLHFAGVKLESHEVHTFSFLILLFMALFSILCVRERGPFWKSRPSKTLALALFLDGLIGILVGWKGIGDLPALRFSAIGIALTGSGLLSLGLNDFLKLIFYRIVPKLYAKNGIHSLN
ncbi:MAG: plasma-membrane proton-efflux P-type ATPase [Bacteriovorax sp.]